MSRPRKSSTRAATVRRAPRVTRADSARAVLDGVRRLDRGLRLAAREVERSTGLSGAQLFVLSHLASASASSLSELAARTVTDRSSVSVVVDRLVAARLVERVISAGDRRRAEVRLTRAGRLRLQHAPAAPTDRLLHAIGTWRVADITRLGALLHRLNTQLGFEKSGLLFDDA